MSTRSFGMVGKSYTSATEAFKDYKYAIAIEGPQKSEYSSFWAVCGVLTALGIILYYGINHF